VGPLLVVLFLLVPVVEIYVIIQVGQLIGPLPTLLLLIFESLLGVWLLKREGRAAWVALQQAAAERRMPATELVDAGLVLVGGTLLVAPGFITDVVGFFFILPPTRPVTRRWLVWLLARRADRLIARAQWEAAGRPTPARNAASGRQRPRARPRGPGGGRPARPKQVIPGELVTDADEVDGRAAGGGPGGPAGGTQPGAKRKNGPDSKGPGRVAGG
jgi:UPF0716 protein FxsA